MRISSHKKPFSTLEKSLFLIPLLVIAAFYVWQALLSNSIALALAKPDHELRGGPGRVNGVLFSPNGKLLLSRRWIVKQQRGYLELWDVENSRLLRTLPDVRSSKPFAAFSHDSSILEIKEGKTAFTTRDANTGEARSKQPHVRPSLIKSDSPVSVSDVSIYGTKAVSKNREFVELRDLRSNKLKFRLYHPQRKEPLFKVTPDGTSVFTFSDIYSADSDGVYSLTLWNAKTGIEKMSIVLVGLSVPSFLNDKIAIIPSRTKITLLNWHTGEIVDSLESPPNTSPRIEQSPDGDTLAATFYDFSDYNQRPIQVVLWDARTKKKSGPLSLPLSSYKDYDSLSVNAYWSGFSADSKTFFIGKQTGLVRFYHARNGKQQYSIELQSVSFENNSGYFQLSPDKKLLGGSGLLVDRLTKKSIPVFYLWDVQNGKLLKRFFTESSGFNAEYFSPDGKWFAVPQKGGSIQLWDLAKLKSKST